MLPPEPKPQMGLALSDLQQSTSNGQTYAIGGGGISGLAIASHSSGSWSTRGVGGIGAASSSFGGLSGSSNYGISGLSNNGAGSQGFGGFGSNASPSNGIFNNCGCSSSDYGLSFSSISFYAHQKQRQNHPKTSLTLIFILVISYVNGQNDFHYANESPNGGVRQFVDNQDVITSTLQATTTPKQQDATFENLPECSMIPNLLCCTSRVLQKCYDGCLKHVQVKCAHKLRQFEHFKADNHFVDRDISQQPLPAALDDTDLLNKRQSSGQISVDIPTTTTQPPTLLPTIPQAPKHIVDVDVPKELPSGGGFIEPLITNFASAKNAIRISDTTRDRVQKEEPASDKCGTAESTPAYLPCYSRQVTDSLFGKCCRESVPAECRSLCTYEHREDVAAKSMIAAVQDRKCDLKWLNAVLYCANQNRDNRPCCQHLNLANPELGVGDRCLRMCNADDKGISVGAIDQRDLVCLSNWNVIMYCARSGIRSLARFHY